MKIEIDNETIDALYKERTRQNIVELRKKVRELEADRESLPFYYLVEAREVLEALETLWVKWLCVPGDPDDV